MREVPLRDGQQPARPRKQPQLQHQIRARQPRQQRSKLLLSSCFLIVPVFIYECMCIMN